MTTSLKLCLVGFFLFELAVSAGFELAHDEAYYWLFSRSLDWGYFDHPPFMAVLIRAFSFLPSSEVSVRLGFILLQVGTVYLLHLLRPLRNSDVFWLFVSFPLASFVGLLALPDMPLLFMSACYFLALRNYLENHKAQSTIVLGLVIGVLLYAKYHGVLLVGFTVLAMPSLLKEKRFYLVAGMALVVFLPHVLWQYAHDFQTLRYHFLERPRAQFSFARSGEYLGTQLIFAGLFLGPYLWWKTIGLKTITDFDRIMKVCALGIVAFFFFSSFSKKVEANWTVSVAIPLIYLALTNQWITGKWKKVLFVSAGIVLLSRLVLVLPPEMTRMKRSHEFHGWKTWSAKIDQLCEGKPILANNYQIASKLSFYLQKNISSLNLESRKNQFDLWRWDLSFPSEIRVCYLTDSTRFSGAEVATPEGRILKVVTTVSLQELQDLRFKNIAN